MEGAALYGAGITRGFRTKDIRVQDVTVFPIDVSYEADKATEGEVAPHILATSSKADPPLPCDDEKQTLSQELLPPICSPCSPRRASKRR